jgi:hypothetical protein
MSLTLGCGACAVAQPSSIIRPAAASHVLRIMLCITISCRPWGDSLRGATAHRWLVSLWRAAIIFAAKPEFVNGQRPLMADHSLTVNLFRISK